MAAAETAERQQENREISTEEQKMNAWKGFGLRRAVGHRVLNFSDAACLCSCCSIQLQMSHGPNPSDIGISGIIGRGWIACPVSGPCSRLMGAIPTAALTNCLVVVKRDNFVK